MKRRLEITWKAYYARDLEEFLLLLEPEGIDYFVFRRAHFYPGSLKNATSFRPYDTLVGELASRHWSDYVYRKLPTRIDLEQYPFMPFRDKQAVIVDLSRLREYLAARD